jgi:tripartite-type tricarboxylate transporter receptor subunit TctC
MKLPRRQFLHLAAGAAALQLAPYVARAQTYPARPITIVVPYAAGGATDTIGRVMAEGMKRPFGQPVIVENATGAGGTIAVGRVARAAPDGYALSLGHSSSPNLVAVWSSPCG